MKIRKERTHQSGLTNLDFRTKGQLDQVDHFEPSLKFSDFGTMSKSVYKRMPSAATFKEQVAISGGWINSKNQNQNYKNTRYETASQFYNTKGKKSKAPVLMAKTREAQLEDLKWNDKAFTGDSNKNAAALTFFARQREMDTMNDRYKGRSSTIDPAVGDRLFRNHAKSPNNGGNLVNRVSIVKVRDARKAFRRRYASRTNLDKIFSQYDADNKGYITAQDLYAQGQKIGLGLSLNEAQCLIQSAMTDQNKKELNIGMDEFADLMFSQDENLKVNLHNISPLSPKGNFQEVDNSNFNQLENRLKYFLQKGLKNVTIDLFRQDEDRKYEVEPEALLKIINKRVQIPSYVTGQQDGTIPESRTNGPILDYAQRFQHENGKIDYKSLVEDIKAFDYQQANFQEGEVPRSYASVRSGMTDAIDHREPRGIFDDDYVILDQKKVTQNVIEQIETRMIKVNRRLKKQFTTKGQFTDKAKKELTHDSNGNVSVDQLKDFVLGLCEKDLIEKRVLKKDIEGFLSAFNYNCYGATNIDDLCTLIYTGDDEIPNRLAERTRANPPPTDINGGITTEGITSEQMHNVKVRKLLNEMEDKVFNGKGKLYHIFKKFDKDNDGYVSYEDFSKCLSQIKVFASDNEISSMMKLIDTQNKGYLSFSEFSKVFSPSMSTQLTKIQENDVYHPNLQPTKDVNTDNIEKQGKMQDAIKNIRKTFQPDVDTQLIAPTRFSAKPNFASTFVNFQQERQGPGYIPEDVRLGKSTRSTFNSNSVFLRSGQNIQSDAAENSLNAKVTFQMEDKYRSQRLQDARIQSKRQHISVAQNLLNNQQDSLDTFTQQKIMMSAARKDNYNKLAGLGN